MLNKESANAIFERNSCLVVDRDVIPERIAIEITSKEAVDFAKKMYDAGFSGYGVGALGTMMYLTRKAFFTAVTYQNVKQEVTNERKD